MSIGVALGVIALIVAAAVVVTVRGMRQEVQWQRQQERGGADGRQR